MDKNPSLSYEKLFAFVRGLLSAAGIAPSHAETAAEAICSASLTGVDSHGLRLLPHYIKAIESGRIDAGAEFVFTQSGHSTGSLDANHGMAHAAVAEGMDRAIELADKAGAGFLSIKNSNHCGAMAYYALKACEHDMIGLAFTNATPKLQVFNSTEPFFGINPICFAAPMEEEEPFCYDASPAVMSNNRIKMFAEEERNLPPDVAADGKGIMTLAPGHAKMLIPLGGKLAGYKGYAMAMMGDILCSLLSGMPGGKDVSAMYEKDGGKMEDKRYLGQFVGAIRIGAFQEVSEFKRRLKETAEEIRSLKKSPDALEEVMVPGDPEKKVKAERLKDGIPVTEALYKQLFSLADKYGVKF